MYMEEIKMNIKPSEKLQDLIDLLDKDNMLLKEFLWFLYDENDNDINFLLQQEAICFGITETKKDYGITHMDIVVVKEIVEGIIEKAWTHVSKDSGTLVLFSDTKQYSYEKLNALMSMILPYNEVGRVVNISKKSYTGLLVQRIK